MYFFINIEVISMRVKFKFENGFCKCFFLVKIFFLYIYIYLIKFGFDLFFNIILGCMLGLYIWLS